MPRRRVAARREILPDYRYNSKLVARFINGLMSDGKKSVAEKIFYTSMDIIEEKAMLSRLLRLSLGVLVGRHTRFLLRFVLREGILLELGG